MSDPAPDFPAVPAAAEAALRRALRHASRRERKYLRMHPPVWLDGRSDLRVLYEDQDLLLREGRVVWGRIVQANDRLFHPVLHRDSPATIIFCPDPDAGHPVPVMNAISRDLFKLKTAGEFANSEEKRYGHMLADERISGLDWLAPESLSRHKRVRSTSIVLPRKHLLCHYLARLTFPILTHPSTSSTMMVPERYWPEDFRAWWKRGANSRAPMDPVPHGLAAAPAKIINGLGFFLTKPLGWFLLLILLLAPFAIFSEIDFHLKPEPVVLEDASGVAALPHDEYVQFPAVLDYRNDVATEDGGADLLIPVHHTGNMVIVLRREEDVLPKVQRPADGTAETITGRVSRKDRFGNPRWGTPAGRIPVLHRFRHSSLTVPGAPVVVTDNEHPGLDLAQITLWSVLAVGHVVLTWRVLRVIRMFRDDEYCYHILARSGYDDA